MGIVSSPPTVSATNSTLLNTPFLQKAPQLSSFKKPSHSSRSSPACTKVSCNSSKNSNNDGQFQMIQNPNDKTQMIFDRRNMLIGLGGMYGAALTLGGGPSATIASPIAPDVPSCTLTDGRDIPNGSIGEHCCPPKFDPNNLVEFAFDKYPSPATKIRRPAHKAMLDKEWLTDYKNALAIMKSLPMSDPRSFLQQARVHCAYCDGAYPVLGQSKRLYVHDSWLFAPFHRWYLYFFERIMGELINKPDFALPYWNWDHPDGMYIPEMFKEIGSPLYNPNRNRKHLNAVLDLSFSADKPKDITEEKQIQENLLLVRKQMLYPTKPLVFFGAPYRAEDQGNPKNGAGALELSPHNNVHEWVGSNAISSNQDMGAFWSSGRDPLFYSHHANVDRMWSIWRNELPGRSRIDLDDPDYLDTYFVLYDENCRPVKCYVKDSLDTEKLGYKYEQQDLPWFKTSAPSPKPTTPSDGTEDFPVVTFPKPLNSVIKTKVVRPRKSRTKEEKEREEEVLMVKFLPGMSNGFMKFDVFVNDTADHNAGEKTEVTPQYAGSFSSLSHNGMAAKEKTLSLAITKLLEDIGASEDETIRVTIVPISGSEKVVITNVQIGFIA